MSLFSVSYSLLKIEFSENLSKIYLENMRIVLCPICTYIRSKYKQYMFLLSQCSRVQQFNRCSKTKDHFCQFFVFTPVNTTSKYKRLLTKRKQLPINISIGADFGFKQKIPLSMHGKTNKLKSLGELPKFLMV